MLLQRPTGRSLFAVALLLALAACHEDPGAPRGYPTSVALGVVPDTLGVGDTVALSARVLDAYGTVLRDSTVRWQSSNPQVLHVLPDGQRLRAIAEGTVVVRARFGPAYDSAVVVVRRLPRRLAFVVARDSLVPMDTTTATTVLVVDGLGTPIASLAPTAVRFASSDTTILHVDSLSGRATARLEGDAHVTVTASAQGVVLRGSRVLRVRWVSLFGGMTGFVQVVRSRYFGCALRDTGLAYCWGRTPYIGLDFNTQVNSANPTPVPSPVLFTSISAGETSACGLAASGEAWCWGYGLPGAVSSPATSPVPLQLPAGAGPIASLQLGSDDDDCVLARDGRTWCWGSNLHYETWRGERTVYEPSALPAVSQLALGEYHACGLALAGSLYCWGQDVGYGGGFVTDTTQPVSGRPQLVATPRPIRQVATTWFGVCALDDVGDVWCWGFNSRGELGITTNGQSFPRVPPTRLAMPGPFEKLYAEVQGACALNRDGELWCWGAPVRFGPATYVPPVQYARTRRFRDFDLDAWDGVCAVTVESTLLCDRRVAFH